MPPTDALFRRLTARLATAQRDADGCAENNKKHHEEFHRGTIGQCRHDHDYPGRRDCSALEARVAALKTALAAVQSGGRVPFDSGFQPSFPELEAKLANDGCGVASCAYHRHSPDENLCAPSLSNAFIEAGYDLPPLTTGYPRCEHADARIRSADDMGRNVLPSLLGRPTSHGWPNAPLTPGVVYVDMPNPAPGESGATGHVDLWDGHQCVNNPSCGPAFGANVQFWTLSNE